MFSPGPWLDYSLPQGKWCLEFRHVMDDHRKGIHHTITDVNPTLQSGALARCLQWIGSVVWGDF